MAKVQSDQNERVEETQDTQSEESPLLFINNYSSGPIMQRYGPDRTTVSVHVQRTIRKKKRLDTMMRLNSREFSRGILKNHIARTDGDRNVASPHQSSIYLVHDPLQTPSMSGATKLQSTLEHNAGAQLFLLGRARSSNQIGISQLVTISIPAPFPDALNSSPHSQSRSGEIALKFFLQTFIPRLFLIPSQAEDHGQWVIQRAVDSPTLYFAITAAGAASFRALTKCYSHSYQDGVISQYDAMSFETIALKHLRFSLNAGESFDSAILTYVIMCHMVTKIINGNNSAVQMHTKAFSRIIRSQEAQIAIPIHVMETFVSICYMSNIITGQPPFSPPLYPTEITEAEAHPLLECIITAYPHLADFGQAFFDPSVEAALDPKLVQLLRNMRAVVLWREHYQCTRENPSNTEMTYFHNLSWQTRFLARSICYKAAESRSENQYQSMPPSAAYAIYARRQHLEEPCCLALLIFWNAYNQVNWPGSLLHRKLAAQLVTALKEILAANNIESTAVWWEHVDEHLHAILLWILLLGVFITRGVASKGGAENDEAFFISIITQYLRLISTRGQRYDWNDVEVVLERYLYSKGIFANVMKQCWVEALEQTELNMQQDPFQSREN